MKYKYQLHTQTAPASKCAKTRPAELAKALYDGGYAGCVMTNHFYHGNTGVSRELSWEEFVRPYVEDYLECKREGEKYGLDVIFGVEEGVMEHEEILCYGITPEMLYSHPELREGSAEEWYRVLHGYGALVIQAHPFRSPCAPLPPEYVDGIEVYNHSHNSEYNEAAEKYAKEHPHFILTSGADSHFPHDAALGGIETDEPIRDGKDLVRILKQGMYRLLKP